MQTANDTAEHPDVLRCLFCGQPERAELFDVWGHEFMVKTCCESLNEVLVEEMNRDPAYRSFMLKQMRVDEQTGMRTRRIVEGDGQFLLDYQLEVRPVEFTPAKAFVHKHHEHCPPPAGWRFGASIWNGPTQMGVVMVGRPVAKAYDPNTVVEVNRLCVRRDTSSALRWNACSQFYGWAAREAEKRGFHKIITYTLLEEDGTSLIAAGWAREAVTKGGSWNSKSRPRTDRSPTGPKVRWVRILCPKKSVARQPRQPPAPAQLSLLAA